LRGGERCSARELDGHGVLRLAGDTHFVVQVRAGGGAGRADIGNDITLADRAAAADAGCKRTQMGIVGFVAIVMPQDDEIAIAALTSCENNGGVAGGLDPGAGGAPKSTPVWARWKP